MKKYYLIARNMWDEILTYRLNFLVWRVRTVLGLVMLYFLWDAIFSRTSNLLGYNHNTILTYILGTSFLQAVVFSSRSNGMADEINNGDLSNFLLRPINYFYYWAAKDIGDKAMNTMFFLGEFTIFYLIVRPPFLLQTNIIYLLLFIIS